MPETGGFPSHGLYDVSVSPDGLGETVTSSRSEHRHHFALRNLTSIFDEALASGIRFCSWKSNAHLAAGLSGETDLDLLVSPEDLEQFRSLALRRGCIAVDPPPDGNHPGMYHLVGLDSGTSNLFHLHVHDRLVLGQRFSKNHVLPMTGMFLETSRVQDGVPQPDPAVELVVLVARALLKYRVRDAVKDLLDIRHPGIPASTQAEVDWCLRAVTSQHVASTLSRCAEVVPRDVVERFLEIARTEPRSGWRLWRLKMELEEALAPHRRRSRVTAMSVYLRELLAARLDRRRDPRLRLSRHGLAIAVVGPDGSGKTTITAELSSWLGEKLAISHYYMGSKQPSPWTSLSYVIFRIFRRGHRKVSDATRNDSMIARVLGWFRDLMLATHHLSVARDRLLRLRRTESDLADGRVVLLDRYPMEAICHSDAVRLLDGPSISTERDGLIARLSRLETRLYERFGVPDAVLLLAVDPMVAMARKPDHDPAVIEQKAAAVEEIEDLMEASEHQKSLYRLDANLDWPGPLQRAKEAVWDLFSSYVPREE